MGKEEKSIRVGIIGAGWWAASAHAPALKSAGNVEIVAACRRDPERLKEFAEKVGVKQTFTDHETMLKEVDLDAVVVCSPHSLHFEHVKAALEHGLPVLTDKPLTVHSSEARELVDLAASKNLLLAVYFGPAYDSRHRYVARMLRDGKLGRLAHISMTCFANPDSLGFFGNNEFQENPDEFVLLPTQFRADSELGGGGYLQDMGSHAFSGMLINTDLNVTEVSAIMDNAELDLRATVSLKFENGATGTVTVAGDMRPGTDRYWGFNRFSCTGDLGTLYRDGIDDCLRYQEWGEPPVEIPAAEFPPSTNPDANFIAALRGECELIAPASEAIKCVQVIEAAYESARSGRTIKLT